MTRKPRSSSALLIVGAAIMLGCAPVRLVESNDPKIEKGMTEYQELLEVFVQQTLVNFELCSINQKELARAEQMQCDADTAEVQALCEAEIQKERNRLAQSTDEACAAASFREAQSSFYIPQEARLNVLKTRASVLDSMGACAAAIKGVTKLVNAIVPSSIKGAVSSTGEDGAPNCTVILIDTVLANHKALSGEHRCLDDINAVGCEAFLPTDPDDEFDRAKQAKFFLPVMLETLLQNVRVVLFIEEAKKRGS